MLNSSLVFIIASEPSWNANAAWTLYQIFALPYLAAVCIVITALALLACLRSGLYEAIVTLLFGRSRRDLRWNIYADPIHQGRVVMLDQRTYPFSHPMQAHNEPARDPTLRIHRQARASRSWKHLRNLQMELSPPVTHLWSSPSGV